MRLLERFTIGWWMAVVSVMLVGALVALAGANLLIPAILTVVAVVVGLVKRKERVDA